MSVRLWNNAGLPTDQCIVTFTKGDCWTLTMALHELDDRLRPFLVDYGAHWAAGDGQRFLDIEGVHSRAQLLRRWNASSLTLAGPELLRYARSDMFAELYDFRDYLTYPRVRDAAERVLSAHRERMKL